MAVAAMAAMAVAAMVAAAMVVATKAVAAMAEVAMARSHHFDLLPTAPAALVVAAVFAAPEPCAAASPPLLVQLMCAGVQLRQGLVIL